jgi:hypothetical protein
MNYRLLAGIAAVAVLPGCASITTGNTQPISVETKQAGQAVTGASCKLENDKGAWFVTTPGSVTVRRSIADMMVSCTKQGAPDGRASVKSSTKAMAFGNVIFGGVIGAVVDVASGAAYDYPSIFNIEMGVAADASKPADSTAPAAATTGASATPAQNAAPAPASAATPAPTSAPAKPEQPKS